MPVREGVRESGVLDWAVPGGAYVATENPFPATGCPGMQVIAYSGSNEVLVSEETMEVVPDRIPENNGGPQANLISAGWG